MNIGERIKELRKRRNISQADLAKEICVSSGNVGDWERGRAKPGADALVALMNYFKVSGDYLLTGKEDKPPQDSSDVLQLTSEELIMIKQFRKLDDRDRQDARENIEMKYSRILKGGTLSSLNIGGTDEEAATSEAV
jgi:transcriptional regulator with XRE-family HTH domain